MTIKRVFLTLLATLLLPGLAWAQTDTRAAFTVYKEFTDGNSETAVTIHMDCFNALPQQQMQTVVPDDIVFNWELEFIAKDFVQGELDCTIWEEEVPGYTAGYLCHIDGEEETSADGNCDNGDSIPEFSGFYNDFDGGPCTFTDVDTSEVEGDSDQARCVIINKPDYVPVTVSKEWVIDNIDTSSVDSYYELELQCNEKISGGDYNTWDNVYEIDLYEGRSNGFSDETYTALVRPDWDGGTKCWVDEDVYDSVIAVENGCGDRSSNADLLVKLPDQTGGDTSCKITNTVFYEGIPTLSQYGMAILALLMLSVGFVGFRRFV